MVFVIVFFKVFNFIMGIVISKINLCNNNKVNVFMKIFKFEIFEIKNVFNVFYCDVFILIIIIMKKMIFNNFLFVLVNELLF